MPKDHDRKTNALRELDAAGVLYEARFFACPEALSGFVGSATASSVPQHSTKPAGPRLLAGGCRAVPPASCYSIVVFIQL